MSKLESLYSISPIDGRYYEQTKCLQSYFSEAALIEYRVKVEVLYFIALINEVNPYNTKIDNILSKNIRSIYENISVDDILHIKEIESITNHDVKAVEYFVKEKIEGIGLGRVKEFVHFCLTSQDINNTAIPLMMKDATSDIVYPEILKIIGILDSLSVKWYDIPMLARTHGQPATPTRVGKELKVFSYRLNQLLEILKNTDLTAKFGGATGGMNAHILTYPSVDWTNFADNFISSMGIKREKFTTQISNYDSLSAYFDAIKRLSTILIDLCRDMWQYISMEYFQQKVKDGEVGSSAMPHKINPIDFENAEGNLGIVVALCNFLSDKLPISRLQRDLTDSTVLRNIGVPLSHFIISCNSINKGLNKIIINKNKIINDLDNNVVVLAEAIQCILRKEGYNNPYEELKNLTRNNKHFDLKELHSFIKSLAISNELKSKLTQLTPSNYLGV